MNISSTRTSRGTLFGIGVGPGDPDLLTLQAIKRLEKVDIILAAASPRNEQSIALSIARPHLREDVETLRLNFPMTRDREILKEAWDNNARLTLEMLNSGKNAAFLTLGDPFVYSTFGYLMRTLKCLDPELSIQVTPGITSFQEAAARTGTILCEGGQSLHILPGILDEEELHACLAARGSAVILKAYRNLPVIRNCLEKAGKEKNCVFVSRLGLDGEAIQTGLAGIEKPNYLSLILAPAEEKNK